MIVLSELLFILFVFCFSACIQNELIILDMCYGYQFGICLYDLSVRIWNCVIFCVFIWFQLGVVVYDIAYPEDRDATNVTITVDRNPSPPVFIPPQYLRTINESYPIGLSLVQLTATDPDNVSKEVFSDNSLYHSGNSEFYTMTSCTL